MFLDHFIDLKAAFTRSKLNNVETIGLKIYRLITFLDEFFGISGYRKMGFRLKNQKYLLCFPVFMY